MFFRPHMIWMIIALTGRIAAAQAPMPGSPPYALAQLLESAAGAGVAERDITSAIFDGRIHPDAKILALAQMGVGGPQQWNQRFGSIGSLSSVKTVVQGQPVTCGSKDLLVRIVMTQGRLYETNVGAPPDLSLNFARTVALLQKSNPSLVPWLNNRVAAADGYYSVVTYFAGDQRQLLTGFGADYEILGKTMARAAPTGPKPGALSQAKSNAGTAGQKIDSVAGLKPTCDELAAHPDDKGKVGAGVIDEQIKADVAIERCSAALAQNSEEPRLHFQLGRAYWKAERYDEALESFLKAEEMDYAPAYFYIGMAYEDGLIEAEQADLAMARDMYMVAASEDFAPAVRAYEDFEESWEVDFKKDFKNAVFAKAIYENKFELWDAMAGPAQDKVEQREKFIVYLRGASDYLEDADPAEEPDCAALFSPEVDKGLEALNRVNNGMPAKRGSIIEEYNALRRATARQQSASDPLDAISRRIPNIQASRQAGTDDMYALTEYGGCAGAPARQFFTNLTRWVTANAAKAR